MSYQALYRKYRPSFLKDVIGQDVVIQILKNEIINNKIGHAYLFSGPRGIGKTSIAKIFAKAVNCNKNKDGDACGKCNNCISINDTSHPDIIEIDAASNNGVDEIREIRNKINLVPNELKYKVYIIDEVHMLSIGAFNALLKTLEEPPEHIIFILATTDLHKVPITIISRCQCFEFHRIKNSDIITRLKYISKYEKIDIDENIFESIAELSDGGLRDAIGMLDKLNAYSNSKITRDDFEKVNGIVSMDEKYEFLNYVFQGSVKEIIDFIDNIHNCGKDIVIFISDLIQICKKMCISHYIEGVNSYPISFLLSFSNMLNTIQIDINNSIDVKTLFEIKILVFINENQKINNLKELNDNKKLSKNCNDDKNKNWEIISREIKQESNNEINQNYINNRLNIIINNCFATANKQHKQLFEELWLKLNDYALDSEYGAVASYISDGTVRAVGEKELIISFNYESMVNRGINLLDKIQILFEKIYNIKYNIALITDERWNDEKKKFIENKKNNISYKYIPLSDDNQIDVVSNLKKNDTTSEAIKLFGEDIILIN